MATVKILDREFTIDCEERDARRLEDLAAALNERVAAGDGDETRRLVMTALALMDEAQTTCAALARARCEIERLTDMVVEAKLEAAGGAGTDERGRVGALRRVAEGAA
jgi:cell division protein ZapA (FtsZ GTPase activity inhibitor)